MFRPKALLTHLEVNRERASTDEWPSPSGMEGVHHVERRRDPFSCCSGYSRVLY